MSPSRIVPCTYGRRDVTHGIDVRCEKMQPKISLQEKSVAENVTSDNSIESKGGRSSNNNTNNSKEV